MKYELTDKTLYDVCEPVEPDEDINNLVGAMWDIVREGKGVGLAANQIGSTKRVIVVNTNTTRTVMVNPVILKTSPQMVSSREGCLSFPGKQVTIPRHKQITVVWRTTEGEEKKQKLRGLDGIVVQHEVDHLNGITCMERANGLG